MRTLIVYHSADYDGTLSRDVCLFYLSRTSQVDDIQTVGWNYGDPTPDITLFDLVYLVDISIPELLVDENYSKLIWIDHHKTAIDRHGDNWIGVRLDGVAACRLTWQWFHQRQQRDEIPTLDAFRSRLVPEPLLLTLAGEYDIWDKRDPLADTLQFGLRASPEFDAVAHFDRAWVSNRLEATRELLDLLDAGAAVEKYQRGQNQRVARMAHDLVWEGLRFCCLNASGNSQVCESVIRPDHAAIFMWRYDGSKVRVSLYGVPHKAELDLSTIAKARGGGGHRQACGFEITLAELQKILSAQSISTGTVPVVVQ